MTTLRRHAGRWVLAGLCVLGGESVLPAVEPPAAPALAPATAAQPLTVDAAIRLALENNPTLRVQRQAHSIAAADVVIAHTYPFNPILENRVQQASGPASAGITNVVPFEEVMTLELEIRGQGKYRGQVASAALSRVDWQIAFQEQTLAVQVVRAFNTLLYQQEKVRLLERTVQLDAGLVADIDRLFTGGKLGPADRIVAETELDSARAGLSAGRVTLATAQAALRSALGVVSENFTAEGTLDVPSQSWDVAALTATALERRPDLHARQSALAEADATLRLTVADRYGNPSVGPAYTYDPTRISLAGVQVNVPLPVFNTHRGAILKSEATRTQALLDVQQSETAIRQDVEAAVAHLRQAQATVTMYRTRVLPHLEQALQDIRRLQANPQGGGAATDVGVLQIVDVQRKLVTAQAAYLDALNELSLARAELFAAVGSMPLGANPCGPAPVVEELPPLTPKHPG